MSKPTQIYIDDSGRVHVSYPCEVCSEWVHTDDHCGDTKPDGTDEYMCSDCYCHKRQGTVCIDCDALRPTIDGSIQPDGWVCSDCTYDRVNKMYIHDWLIFLVDFDHSNHCGVYRIAIHKDVVNPKKAWHADCSSPDPDEGITRYGPGTCATALDCIESMHATINDVYTLVDEGYIRGDKAHLIFQDTYCPDCNGTGEPLPDGADHEEYSRCGNCKGWTHEGGAA